MKHPRYSDMKEWTPKQIETHLQICQGTRDGKCVPGINALEMARTDAQHRRWAKRLADTPSTVSGASVPVGRFAKALGMLGGTHGEFGRKIN